MRLPCACPHLYKRDSRTKFVAAAHIRIGISIELFLRERNAPRFSPVGLRVISPTKEEHRMNNETQVEIEQSIGTENEQPELDDISTAIQVRAGIHAGRQLIPCV
jgi:hypothetical protein